MSYEKTLAEVRRLSEGATVLLPVRREPKRFMVLKEPEFGRRVAKMEAMWTASWKTNVKPTNVQPPTAEVVLGTFTDFERRGD